MALEFDPRTNSGYAAFRLRFRALLVDVGISLAIFLIGGIVAGVVLEQYPLGRVAAFTLIVGTILCYEPIMVSQYGGTLGHRALNIRVVQANTERNLTLPKAVVRALIKQFLGLFSLAFMFVTKKAQGLHDFAVGSEVRVRNPQVASPGDYFVPDHLLASPSLPSAARRTIIIALYNVLLFLIVSAMAGLSISSTCLDQDICTSSERQELSLLSFLWLAVSAVLISLGWTARLPGARRNRSVMGS